MKRENATNEEEDDEVWGYCSLRKQQKRCPSTKRSKNLTKGSKPGFIAHKKSQQDDKIQKVQQNSQSSAHNSRNTESAVCKTISGKSCTTSITQRKQTPHGKERTSFKCAHLSSSSTKKERVVHDGNCPFCQMPFSILVVESPRWHVMECMDLPIITGEECSAGLNCDITISSHFRRYKHTALANTRAGLQNNSNSDLGNAGDGIGCDGETPIDQAKRKLSFSTLKPPSNDESEGDSILQIISEEQETPIDIAKKKLFCSDQKAEVFIMPIINTAGVNKELGHAEIKSENLEEVEEELPVVQVDQAKRKLSFNSMSKKNVKCQRQSPFKAWETVLRNESPYFKIGKRSNLNSETENNSLPTSNTMYCKEDTETVDTKPLNIKIQSVISLAEGEKENKGFESEEDIFKSDVSDNDGEINQNDSLDDLFSELDSLDVDFANRNISVVSNKNEVKKQLDKDIANENVEVNANYGVDNNEDSLLSSFKLFQPKSAEKLNISPNIKSKIESPTVSQPTIFSFFNQGKKRRSEHPPCLQGVSTAIHSNNTNIMQYTTGNKTSHSNDLPLNKVLRTNTVVKRIQAGKSAFDLLKQPPSHQSPWHLRSSKSSKASGLIHSVNGNSGHSKESSNVCYSELQETANSANSSATQSKGYYGNKKCPFYKKIPGTPFTVDAFRYGTISGCSAYFLTHFHYDHYMGLSKKFSHPIYCSKITANLVQRKLYVNSKHLNSIQLNTPTMIEGAEITFLEANHCPGSVLILFKLKDGRAILHTGDFRANSEMETYPSLNGIKVHQLYLDTTYCDPTYAFPPQNDVINFAVNLATDYMFHNPNALIAIGSYTIGKERIFLAIAEALNCKICVSREKKNVLDCLEDSHINKMITLKMMEARVHVLPMRQLNICDLSNYVGKLKPRFDKVLAFEPTGWTHSNKVPSLENIKPKAQKDGVTLYGVPYSEHSSYTEMKKFTQFIAPDKIIPTVNNGNPSSRKKMESLFSSWMHEKEDSPSKRLKQSGMKDWFNSSQK